MKGMDRNWGLLLISLLAGGVAAWAIGYYLEEKELALQEKYRNNNVVYVDVVVANQQLGKGETINPKDFTVRKIPAEYVSADALLPSEFKRADGQMLLEPIEAGKPLLSSYLPGRGAQQFSDILAVGQRAVTIEIDDANSSAGMMVAGDKIDLYLMHKPGDVENDHEQLRLIIEDITVLATGKITVEHHPELVGRMFGDPSMYNTITVGVDLFDAGRLNLAKKRGSFVALLRNRTDKRAVNSKFIAATDVFLEQQLTTSVEFIIGGGGGGVLTSTKQQQIKKVQQTIGPKLANVVQRNAHN